MNDKIFGANLHLFNLKKIYFFTFIIILSTVMFSKTALAGAVKLDESSKSFLSNFPKKTQDLKDFQKAVSECLSTSNSLLDTTQADLPCAREYANTKNTYWIVELCRPTTNFETGIYIVDQTGLRFFKPYDDEFFKWACTNDCDDCKYSATTSKGEITRFIYDYQILVSYGSYDVSIDGDTLKVIHKENTDDS